MNVSEILKPCLEYQGRPDPDFLTTYQILPRVKIGAPVRMLLVK